MGLGGPPLEVAPDVCKGGSHLRKLCWQKYHHLQTWEICGLHMGLETQPTVSGYVNSAWVLTFIHGSGLNLCMPLFLYL